MRTNVGNGCVDLRDQLRTVIKLCPAFVEAQTFQFIVQRIQYALLELFNLLAYHLGPFEVFLECGPHAITFNVLT